MAILDLIKRNELAAPLSQLEFDTNLSQLEAFINAKVDLTDVRLTNARTPTAHQHGLADLPAVVAALLLKADSSSVTTLEDLVGNLQDEIGSASNVPGTRWSIGRPSDSLGIDGDFCFDISPGVLILYGPKGQSGAAPGTWQAVGKVLISPGDGTVVFMTEAALEAAAIAGTLSPSITYRITGTDETAIVLAAETAPHVVQITSPTKKARLLVHVLQGRVLSSSLPTWNIIFNCVLEDAIITDPDPDLIGNDVPGPVPMEI